VVNGSGTKKWTYTTGDTIVSSPALASDGTIYIGSYDHKLYAFYGRSKLASTAWPMFHHDRKHTGRRP
jgi:outer membrane protein assembly factor BamB